MIQKVNDKGYLMRRTSKEVYRDWWLGHDHMGIHINTLPKRFHGKHIMIKIEIVEDTNSLINQMAFDELDKMIK